MMLSQYVAYSCFAAGCLLICWPNTQWFSYAFIGLQGLLTVAGVSIMLARSSYRSARLAFLPTDTHFVAIQRTSTVAYYTSLWLVQGVFAIVSLVFFLTVEHISQLNPRLQSLASGQILAVVQEHPFSMGVLPWVLYGIAGVALAYFSVCQGRTPTFAHAIVPNSEQHPRLFFHNYIFIVIEAVKLGALWFLLTLSIIWLYEGFSTWMGWPSLFKTPMKGVVICALMMIAFRKPHQNCLEWLRKKQVPLGGMLAFYALCFSFIILWGHGVGDILVSGIEETDPNKIYKSPLVNFFLAGTENDRLTFLVWGWWGLWLPWVASTIARLSLGRTVGQALLSAVVFPMVIFWGVSQWVTLEHWVWLTIELQYASVQLGIALFLLLSMILFLGHVQSSKDILRGGMLSFGKLSGVRPLRQWVNLCIMCTIFNFPGLFVLGWLPLQLLCTLGAVFTTTVMLGLIWRLFSSKDLVSVATKHKVQGVL